MGRLRPDSFLMALPDSGRSRAGVDAQGGGAQVRGWGGPERQPETGITSARRRRASASCAARSHKLPQGSFQRPAGGRASHDPV